MSTFGVARLNVLKFCLKRCPDFDSALRHRAPRSLCGICTEPHDCDAPTGATIHWCLHGVLNEPAENKTGHIQYETRTLVVGCHCGPL